jgi:uncharacterized membrane protein YwzB
MPSLGSGKEIHGLDIIIHYSIFISLAFISLVYFCKIAHDRELFYKSKNKSGVTRKRIWLVMIAIMVFILVSEFIQENFIPGRGYELKDILAGTAGLVSGFVLYKKIVFSKENTFSQKI